LRSLAPPLVITSMMRTARRFRSTRISRFTVTLFRELYSTVKSVLEGFSARSVEVLLKELLLTDGVEPSMRIGSSAPAERLFERNPCVSRTDHSWSGSSGVDCAEADGETVSAHSAIASTIPSTERGGVDGVLAAMAVVATLCLAFAKNFSISTNGVSELVEMHPRRGLRMLPSLMGDATRENRKVHGRTLPQEVRRPRLTVGGRPPGLTIIQPTVTLSMFHHESRDSKCGRRDEAASSRTTLRGALLSVVRITALVEFPVRRPRVCVSGL
jgi:hypothetical protein